MKIVKKILKGIGILCLLFVILCVVAVACSSNEETSTTTAAVEETTTEAEETTEPVTEATTEEPTTEEETEEVVEVVATTETDELEEITAVSEEDAASRTLSVHGISIDTVRKILTAYEYIESFVEALSDDECLTYFENFIETYNYKITEDGWGYVEWQTDEDMAYLRYCISNSDNENTILSVDEANALPDDDVIGIYGMMYNYELYTQDDPGKEDSNYWEVTKDNVVDVIRNAQEGDYIHISNGIVSLPINRGNNIIIYPSDGLSYDPSNCFRLVVTDLDMRFSNGDHLEIYGTFDYQDDIAWIIPESVSYLN
ncbi:MAG: hypothetical protein LUE65_03385 [Clostridiales bacterium]|nr:hypothetical protein [Clostridiales bacterium]